MELTDIKHNKGATTLQARSIAHLKTWLRRDQTVSSELNIKPLELSAELMGAASQEIGLDAWWDPSSKEEVAETAADESFKEPVLFQKAEARNQVLDLAKKLNMTTDIKKAVLHAVVLADDYVQAFENCQRLNLKKQQQREIIKVIVQLCVSDRKKFNPFYFLLAQRLIKENPQSYRYSFKYTLWDYLKALDKFDLEQIKNLAKLTGCLIYNLSAPLHFLKIIDFQEESEQAAQQEGNVSAFSQPIQLFLFFLFELLFDPQTGQLIGIPSSDPVAQSKRITQIFEQGFPEKHDEFGKGLSQYLLTKFYKRIKKLHKTDGIPKAKEALLRCAFDVIKKKSEDEFLAAAMRKKIKK